MSQSSGIRTHDRSAKAELGAFLLVNVILLPGVIIGVLGAYALGVWIYQTFAGYGA